MPPRRSGDAAPPAGGRARRGGRANLELLAYGELDEAVGLHVDGRRRLVHKQHLPPARPLRRHPHPVGTTRAPGHEPRALTSHRVVSHIM